MKSPSNENAGRPINCGLVAGRVMREYLHNVVSQNHVALDIKIYFSFHHRPLRKTRQVLKFKRLNFLKRRHCTTCFGLA
jgi:hypothetical protein